MKKILKIITSGILIWLISFAVGAFLYATDSRPRLDPGIISNISILLTTTITLTLLTLLLKNQHRDHLRQGLTIGLSWQIINSGMDLAIIAPVAGMSVSVWWWQIGLGHFIFPIMGTAAGLIARHASKPK